VILAVDTTHEFGSIALVHDTTIVEEVPLHAPTGFAHILYEHLRALLDRHAITVRDIDCFAAASGPGSFTGVRVGLACIKGLAEATHKPAVGISNLQAISCFGAASLRATLLDARRGEIYGAVYDAEARLVTPEVVAKLEDWLASLPSGDLEFISPNVTLERVTRSPAALAGVICQLAARRLATGESPDPSALDANYVRRSDAELFWKE